MDEPKNFAGGQKRSRTKHTEKNVNVDPRYIEKVVSLHKLLYTFFHTQLPPLYRQVGSTEVLGKYNMGTGASQQTQLQALPLELGREHT